MSRQRNHLPQTREASRVSVHTASPLSIILRKKRSSSVSRVSMKFSNGKVLSLSPGTAIYVLLTRRVSSHTPLTPQSVGCRVGLASRVSCLSRESPVSSIYYMCVDFSLGKTLDTLAPTRHGFGLESGGGASLAARGVGVVGRTHHASDRRWKTIARALYRVGTRHPGCAAQTSAVDVFVPSVLASLKFLTLPG